MRKNSVRLLTFTLMLLSATVCRSHAAGDEVVVVYNTRSPESRRVADHYARIRNVPTNQIFGFALPTGDDMSRAEFRDQLQKPLAKAIQDAKLWTMGSDFVRATNNRPAAIEWRVKQSKIRYAVLCYGVPFRIRKDPNLKEEIAETLRPEFRRNEAAVDSELALLPRIEQNVPAAGPVTSPFYSATNAAFLHPTNGILIVARLDGPTAEIARGLVDKAIEAERNGLWGRAYFDVRGIADPGYKQGDDWIRNSAELCRNLGFESIVDTNAGTFTADFPMSHIGIYCGWYDTEFSGPFKRNTVEFMPGAFAYHLQSFSASRLRSPTNDWVGPLLSKGATITMGCVDEPYLLGTPDLPVFLSRLIFSGFTFGESAFAAQAVLSWQITVVGDPLYRPFGTPPQEMHEHLAREKNSLLEWSHLRVVNLNIAKRSPLGNLVGYLEEIDTTTNSAVLTEKLGDLYLMLGKPSSAIETYRKALERGPSTLQRVRIRLNISKKLAGQDRDRELYDNNWSLLQEVPDYAGRFEVMKETLNVAIKLVDKNRIIQIRDHMSQYKPD